MKTKFPKRMLVISAVVVGVLGLSGCGAMASGSGSEQTTSTSSSDTNWSTQAVAADATDSSKTTPFTYKPISVDKVKKNLTVCVLFPNMADDYWVAANHGTLQEAQRDKVTYVAYNAGGYENLQTQLNQIDGCINQKVSAIAMAAVSDGACSGAKKAIDAGIPVVDFINGMNCPDLVGNPKFVHVFDGPVDYGANAAEMLIKENKPVHVALLPGPDGTPFVDTVSKAFKDKIKGTKVTLVVDKRGALTEDAQLTLIEDVLRTYPQVDATVGPTVAGTAAVTAIRNAGKQGQVKAYQYSTTKTFYQDILDGTGAGSVSDVAPISGRMAFDQAVRLASGVDPATTRIGPQVQIVTKDNIKTIPYENMMAPQGFKPTYNWAPGE